MMCADSMSTSRSLSSQNTPTCSISGHAEKEGTMSKTSRTLRRWITVSSAEYKGRWTKYKDNVAKLGRSHKI